VESLAPSARVLGSGIRSSVYRPASTRLSPGDLALVYVSSPAKELRGSFEVGKVLTASPSALWRKVGKKSGVTRAEFFAYFKGKNQAHALVIKRAWRLPIGRKT
jgi:large subunit ribosomal protein L22